MGRLKFPLDKKWPSKSRNEENVSWSESEYSSHWILTSSPFLFPYARSQRSKDVFRRLRSLLGNPPRHHPPSPRSLPPPWLLQRKPLPLFLYPFSNLGSWDEYLLNCGCFFFLLSEFWFIKVRFFFFCGKHLGRVLHLLVADFSGLHTGYHLRRLCNSCHRSRGSHRLLLC